MNPCCADCHVLTFSVNIPMVGCSNRRCYCHTWKKQQVMLRDVATRLATVLEARRLQLVTRI